MTEGRVIALKCPVCGNLVSEAIDGGCTERCNDIFNGTEPYPDLPAPPEVG